MGDGHCTRQGRGTVRPCGGPAVRGEGGNVIDLAAVGWNRHFRRTCLDPVCGLITLSSSRLH